MKLAIVDESYRWPVLTSICLALITTSAPAANQQFECGKAKTIIIREWSEEKGDAYKDKNQKPLPSNLFRWGGEGDTLFYKDQRCRGPY